MSTSSGDHVRRDSSELFFFRDSAQSGAGRRSQSPDLDTDLLEGSTGNIEANEEAVENINTYHDDFDSNDQVEDEWEPIDHDKAIDSAGNQYPPLDFRFTVLKTWVLSLIVFIWLYVIASLAVQITLRYPNPGCYTSNRRDITGLPNTPQH